MLDAIALALRGTTRSVKMRTAKVLAVVFAVAGSAMLALPANAQRVCNENCVGPLCTRNCVDRDRDVTIGRGHRDRDVIIEERRHHEPSIELRERHRPDVEVEVGR
jgi:hypothetical protein